MLLVFGSWLALAALAWGLFRVWTRAPRQAVPDQVGQFVQQLRDELANRFPQVEIRGMIPGRLAAVLAVRGQELPVSLHPLFRRVVAFPDAFGESVAQLIDEVEAEALERTSDHSFADVATSILPQIRTDEWLRDRGSVFGEAALVHRELTEGLVVCYVIDTPWCMTFVCRAHLRQWGIDEAGLYHLSIRNLAHLDPAPLPLPGPEEAGVLLRTGDGFDAARVLLLDRDQTEGMLVALPDRDVLWLGSDGAQPLDRLMALNGEQTERGEHPLSSQLYRMSDGKLVPVNG